MNDDEITAVSLYTVDEGDTDKVSPAALESAALGHEDREASLLALSGALAGRTIKLVSLSMNIGRGSDCDICIPEKTVSRRHARIERKDDKHAVIIDLNSTNGTYVNGVRITRCALQDGDRIQVSPASILKFSYQDRLEETFHRIQYEQAVRDELTGVFNRRYFLDALRQALAYALRHKSPTTLALVDIDHFKKINDTYGHQAGDEVLRWLAESVGRSLRDEDTFGRYGGDEFSVILPGLDEQNACRMAERLRTQVEASVFRWDDREIPVTVSLGISTRIGNDLCDSKRMLDLADKNLYAAKRAGRNCTVSTVALRPAGKESES